MKNVICLAGNARSGKDSTCAILSKYIKCRRIALADALKAAIDPVCKDTLGISAFTTNDEEKKIIRDLLVVLGCTARKVNKRTWIDKIIPLINNTPEDTTVVITDIRFDEGDGDEADFAQKELKGMLVLVDRILDNGEVLQGINELEKDNYPRLKARADVVISAKTLEELEQEVLRKILPRIKQ